MIRFKDKYKQEIRIATMNIVPGFLLKTRIVWAHLRPGTIVGHRVTSTIVYGYNNYCVRAQLCPCSIVCDNNLCLPNYLKKYK